MLPPKMVIYGFKNFLFYKKTIFFIKILFIE